MSYKPRSLFGLIEDINVSLFLPHIQRPFVWSEEQIDKLFDSLMRNYPIQTLLFWRTKDEIKARRFMQKIDWDAELRTYYDSVVSKEGKTKTFVLDGQQRIQSLYAIFSGGIESEDGKTVKRAHLDVTVGQQSAEDGILFSVKWSEAQLPLPMYQISDLLGKDEKKNAGDLAESINDQLDLELQELDDVRKLRQKRVRSTVQQLVSLLREDKHFWVEELDGIADEYSYKKVLEIFVRVNSGGTKLDAADLMFSVMKEGWDEVEEKVEAIVDMLRSSTNLPFDKDIVLKCLVLAHGRGPELSADKFNSADGKNLLREISDTWDEAEDAFQQLSDFIAKDLHLFSEKVVRTYGSFIPLFDYLFHNPKPKEIDRAMMRGYHYKAQLFGWFRAQTDTIISALHSRLGKKLPAFPIAEIKTYFADNRKVQVEFSESDLEDVRLRFIILNLVYSERFGNSPFKVQFKGNEPHVDHIFPKSSLKNKLGLQATDINVIENFRFLGATDNLKKRAEEPGSYFLRLKVNNIDIMKHLLVPEYADDPLKLKMTLAIYSDFRNKRRAAISEICFRAINPEL